MLNLDPTGPQGWHVARLLSNRRRCFGLFPRAVHISPFTEHVSTAIHRQVSAMGRPPARRACDRCHIVKEKCRRIPGQDACERCLRLQNSCQTLRPVGTAGRKPRYQRNEESTQRQLHMARSDSSLSTAASSPQCPASAASPAMPDWDLASLPRTPSSLADLTEREMHLVKGVSQGRTRIDQFLVASSFRITHHKAFAQQLHDATLWVQDSLLATAALLACEYEPGSDYEDRIIGHRRAASAISTLRSVKAVDLGDLPTILMLSVSAITFALHISGQALEICRHSLNLIKPVYESSTELTPDCLAFVICLVQAETEECILRGEVPTLRFTARGLDDVVDRYLGIASPMLPYLYDVCTITSTLRNDKHVDISAIMQALDAIEAAVEAWEPRMPEGHITRFLQEEVASILAQARLYRWSVLLIAHRLRHPYGSAVEKGTVISNAILEELRLTLQSTGRSVPGATVPYMFACFELVDPVKRELALKKIDAVVEFSKAWRTKIKKQLTAFWLIKDNTDRIHWSDMVSWFPQ
ncbi:unnamed protein product [Alternaria burnsii]|nr:unnamed protein product [Alternaria burnsii]